MTSVNIQRLLKLPTHHSFFLFGPRQVGKTTLIRDTFPAECCLVYDLLIPEELRRLKMNPGRFRDEIIHRDPKYTHVFIDELQKIPEILDEVHYLLETLKPAPNFILSGSSARKLKRVNANMLGGRAFSFSLYGLSYLELLKSSQFSLYHSLELGSLPAIYLSSREDAILSLRSYVNTYIKEEIQFEALVRNLDIFTEFLRLAANENANILNYSKIAADLGVSSATVREYYQILEDTLLGFYLRPYSSRLRKKLAKHPKFYFFDTGVVRALQYKLSLELAPKTAEFGKVFEHFIIKEFIHLATYLKPDYQFSYYRTENNAEVDLIIETPEGKTFAIEIKASDNPRLSDLRGLRSFKSLIPEAELYCASLTNKRFKLDNSIWIYPWQELLNLFYRS